MTPKTSRARKPAKGPKLPVPPAGAEAASGGPESTVDSNGAMSKNASKLKKQDLLQMLMDSQAKCAALEAHAAARGKPSQGTGRVQRRTHGDGAHSNEDDTELLDEGNATQHVARKQRRKQNEAPAGDDDDDQPPPKTSSARKRNKKTRAEPADDDEEGQPPPKRTAAGKRRAEASSTTEGRQRRSAADDAPGDDDAPEDDDDADEEQSSDHAKKRRRVATASKNAASNVQDDAHDDDDELEDEPPRRAAGDGAKGKKKERISPPAHGSHGVEYNLRFDYLGNMDLLEWQALLRDVREQASECHLRYTDNWRQQSSSHLRAFVSEMRRLHPFLRAYKDAWPALDLAHQVLRNRKSYRSRKTAKAQGEEPASRRGRDHVADGKLGGGRSHRRWNQ